MPFTLTFRGRDSVSATMNIVAKKPQAKKHAQKSWRVRSFFAKGDCQFFACIVKLCQLGARLLLGVLLVESRSGVLVVGESRGSGRELSCSWPSRFRASTRLLQGSSSMARAADGMPQNKLRRQLEKTNRRDRRNPCTAGIPSHPVSARAHKKTAFRKRRLVDSELRCRKNRSGGI